MNDKIVVERKKKEKEQLAIIRKVISDYNFILNKRGFNANFGNEIVGDYNHPRCWIELTIMILKKCEGISGYSEVFEDAASIFIFKDGLPTSEDSLISQSISFFEDFLKSHDKRSK